MTLLLGVDGGQSSTRTFLADASGRIMGACRTGPSNHIFEPGGLERQYRALHDGMRGAFAAAGLDPREVDVACVGLTGRGHPPTIERALPARVLRLFGDVEAAFAGALPHGVGVVVVGGTGSIAYRRDESGATHRTGGWGYLAGDEGSAYDLGRQAFRAVYRAYDGRGPAATLRERLCAHFGARDLEELRDTLYGPETSRADVAGCARLVAEAAADGDAVAAALLRDAGAALADLAGGVLAHLDSSAAARVVLIGGLTAAGSPLRDALREALQARHPAAELHEPALDPSRGALVLALQDAGVDLNERVLAHLRADVTLHPADDLLSRKDAL